MHISRGFLLILYIFFIFIKFKLNFSSFPIHVHKSHVYTSMTFIIILIPIEKIPITSSISTSPFDKAFFSEQRSRKLPLPSVSVWVFVPTGVPSMMLKCIPKTEDKNQSKRKIPIFSLKSLANKFAGNTNTCICKFKSYSQVLDVQITF